jgi:hypothetical protein
MGCMGSFQPRKEVPAGRLEACTRSCLDSIARPDLHQGNSTALQWDMHTIACPRQLARMYYVGHTGDTHSAHCGCCPPTPRCGAGTGQSQQAPARCMRAATSPGGDALTSPRQLPLLQVLDTPVTTLPAAPVGLLLDTKPHNTSPVCTA